MRISTMSHTSFKEKPPNCYANPIAMKRSVCIVVESRLLFLCCSGSSHTDNLEDKRHEALNNIT